jgi:serine/threonine-protein kinase
MFAQRLRRGKQKGAPSTEPCDDRVMAPKVEWLEPEELLDVGSEATIRPETLRAGTRLGRYELVMPVAFGGMARVWAARLVGIDGFRRLFALKTMLPHLAREDEIAKLFRDEAVLAARVHHPNVCAALELGAVDEVTYLALEWIDGEPLMKLLRPGDHYTPFEPNVAVRIVRDVCLGIHAAHEAVDDDGRPLGTIHRDLTPHNVMVNLDGHAKIVDFGVARSSLQWHEATAAGQLRGKLAYMPPEQIGGQAIDRRVDVFALGCMLYECVVGARAFQGPTEPAIMQAIMRGEFVPASKARPGVPVSLDGIIAKALASDPEKRFRSADALADALDAFSHAHGEASPRDVGDAVSVRGGGSIVLRRARIAEALARLDGRVLPGEPRVPVPVPSAPYVPSSSGVVDARQVAAGRYEPAPDSERTTVGAPFEASEAASNPPIPPATTTHDLLPRGEVPSFVSSGDLDDLATSGGQPVLPQGHRLAFVQAILVTVLVAIVILGLRLWRS